jgi:hypothetical protein
LRLIVTEQPNEAIQQLLLPQNRRGVEHEFDAIQLQSAEVLLRRFNERARQRIVNTFVAQPLNVSLGNEYQAATVSKLLDSSALSRSPRVLPWETRQAVAPATTIRRNWQ